MKAYMNKFQPVLARPSTNIEFHEIQEDDIEGLEKLEGYFVVFNECSEAWYPKDVFEKEFTEMKHKEEPDTSNSWRLASEYAGMAMEDFAKTGVDTSQYIECLEKQEKDAFLGFVDSTGGFILELLNQDDKYVEDFVSYHSL